MRLFGLMGMALAGLLAAGVGQVQAQPNSAQASAIRANCRSDYQSFCAAVPPGGQASLACLEQHAAQLSPPCRQAVGAAAGAGAATAPTAPMPNAPMPGAPIPGAPPAATAGAAPHAAPQPHSPPHGALSPLPPISPREEMFLMRNACGMDFRRLCAGVPLGGGNSLRCLANHSQSLSPRCEQALMMLHARR